MLLPKSRSGCDPSCGTRTRASTEAMTEPFIFVAIHFYAGPVFGGIEVARQFSPPTNSINGGTCAL
jgi:hypothetical protein